MQQSTVSDTFDTHAFRHALAQFATGITVITARAPAGPDGQPGRVVGVTANSFNSVSLHPALVLWSLSNKSNSMDVFRTCTHYAVNVLSAEQKALSVQFSTHDIDRFEGVDCSIGLGGAPLLEGALARFECRNRSQYQEGDHVILVGEVERFSMSEGAPLVYFDRRYHSL